MNKCIARLLVLGDIHANVNALLNILHYAFFQNVDYIITVGDIGPDILGDRLNVENLRLKLYSMETLSLLLEIAALKKDVYFILGNHDMPEFNFLDDTNKYLHNVDVNANGAMESNDNISIIGFGGSPKSECLWPNEWDDNEIIFPEKYINKWKKSKIRVLVTHTPPKNCWLDIDVDRSRHLGSDAIRNLLISMKIKPSLMLCGHIHEGFGVDIVCETPCVNVGSLLGPFNEMMPILQNLDAINESHKYFLIDLYKDFVHIHIYQSCRSMLYPFIEIGKFYVNKNKISMIIKDGAFDIQSSDEAAPIIKTNEYFEPRIAVKTYLKSELLKVLNLKGRINDD